MISTQHDKHYDKIIIFKWSSSSSRWHHDVICNQIFMTPPTPTPTAKLYRTILQQLCYPRNFFRSRNDRWCYRVWNVLNPRPLAAVPKNSFLGRVEASFEPLTSDSPSLKFFSETDVKSQIYSILYSYTILSWVTIAELHIIRRDCLFSSWHAFQCVMCIVQLTVVARYSTIRMHTAQNKNTYYCKK